MWYRNVCEAITSNLQSKETAELCAWITEVPSVQSTMMGRSQHVGNYRGSLSTVYNDGEISTCGWIIEVHSVQPTMIRISQHVDRL